MMKPHTANVMIASQKASVSWAPVGRPEDLFTDAHLAATNGLLDVVVQGAAGGQSFGLPAMPFEFAEGRPGLRGQPPELGADTRDVLRATGLGDDEISVLAEAKIIALP